MAIAKRDPRVVTAPQYLAQRRVSRRPQHRMNLKLVPYEIQPFMLAPILPGETLENVMLQSQTWSDPLKAETRNIGWWLQYNYFYVRHRDLPADVRTLLANMLLDESTDMSAIQATSQSYSTYTYDGAIDWTALCLEHVVSEYFRDDGEADDVSVGPSGLPLCQIYGRGTSDGLERLTLDVEYEDRRVDLVQSGHLYADDMSTMLGHWQAMRDAGLTEMDYQDFMKTYGSTVREDEESPNLHRAEDIWSLREFTYPTNTVEPTTGVPAVAAGWRVQKSGGKRILADEPGFIFGVTYARPKIYLRAQKGSLAGMMASVKQWLPPMLHEHADLGHVLHDYAEGPLPNLFKDTVPDPDVEHGYWLDIRDLLVYGDQFINYDPATAEPFSNLPLADGSRRYVATNEVRKMFATAFAATGVFYMDGVSTLSIKGRQRASQSGLVLGQS